MRPTLEPLPSLLDYQTPSKNGFWFRGAGRPHPRHTATLSLAVGSLIVFLIAKATFLNVEKGYERKNLKRDAYKVVILISTGVTVGEGSALIVYRICRRKLRLYSSCSSRCCVVPESHACDTHLLLWKNCLIACQIMSMNCMYSES